MTRNPLRRSAALDLGINWIDTAAIYGLGRSENHSGQSDQGSRAALHLHQRLPGLGRAQERNVGHNLKAASLRREVEASLKRLYIDVIYLYQIH